MAQDFYGFTFNGKHSSELHILRTSNGSRYEEGLLPSFDNKTTTINGYDGTYYFGSDYSARPFNIQIAFDKLTEKDLRELRQWFGDKKIHPLIFDEVPYKVYMARVDNLPTLQYICFDDNEFESEQDLTSKRIYKGEGNIQLICYYPFARCRYKWLEEYTVGNIPEWQNGTNLNEWIESSGIINQAFELNNNNYNYDQYIPTENKFYVYNAGDIETDYKLKLTFYNNTISAFDLSLDSNILSLKTINKKGNDYGIQINTSNHLIEGINALGDLTGNVYNDYINAGDFFKIPAIADTMELTTSVNINSYSPVLNYDYIYF